MAQHKLESHRDWRHPCYKVETAHKKWGRGEVYVVHPITKKVVLKSELEQGQDIDAPKIGKWDNEWAYMATGKRMSKSELKSYCRENGKTWID